MKKRHLILELTDEEAATFDAVRFLHGDTHAMTSRVTTWLLIAAADSEVQRLRKVQGSRLRRGLRHLRSVS